MYQKFKNHIEQIKNSRISLYTMLKFKDHTKQIKSSETTLYIKKKFENYLCHFLLVVLSIDVKRIGSLLRKVVRVSS